MNVATDLHFYEKKNPQAYLILSIDDKHDYVCENLGWSSLRCALAQAGLHPECSLMVKCKFL